MTRYRRTLTLIALTIALTACNGEDPDPCDPTCPPTTENPTGD